MNFLIEGTGLEKVKAYDLKTKEICNIMMIDFENQKIKLDGITKLRKAEDVKILKYAATIGDLELFEGDILQVSNNLYLNKKSPMTVFRGVLKFGEYEQDGSGGEYGTKSVIGFYLQSNIAADQCGSVDEPLEFEELQIFDYERTQSFIKFDNIERLGSIYNPKDLSLLEDYPKLKTNEEEF